MFWSKKKKAKKAEKAAKAKAEQSAKIREEAMANARAAREALGDETIQKITEAMTAMEQQSIRKAQKQIQSADPDKVLDELKFMMDQKDSD